MQNPFKNFRKKIKLGEIPHIELSVERTAEILKQIISEKEKELVYNLVQCWIWTLESVDPVKTGKAEAERWLGEYQKRNRELEGQIMTFKAYAEEHNIINL